MLKEIFSDPMFFIQLLNFTPQLKKKENSFSIMFIDADWKLHLVISNNSTEPSVLLLSCTETTAYSLIHLVALLLW